MHVRERSNEAIRYQSGGAAVQLPAVARGEPASMSPAEARASRGCLFCRYRRPPAPVPAPERETPHA